MKYEYIVQGIFIERPNRFIAEVMIEGVKVRAHVKNTGRCRELLVSGATVYLTDHCNSMGSRKLRYSLIAVEKGEMLFNIDSQAPNEIVGEALSHGNLPLPGMCQPYRYRREQVVGQSRLDFIVEDCLGRIALLEVKGVTLEDNAHARFPDAPTLRGRKHLEELEKGVVDGYLGYVVFVLQMRGMKSFRPNDEMDPAFGSALRRACKTGVVALAFDCLVKPDLLMLNEPIPIELSDNLRSGYDDILGV